MPPGFRFHPRDEELVCDYLMRKVTSAWNLYPLMIQVDLNKCEPWDIPEITVVGGKESYFYSQRDRKYATGLRTNRATVSGYWKATGKDRPVLRKGTLVGMRKTLVFYEGRAPKGRKTDWVMHEFRLEGPLCPPNLSSHKEDWVLCRVFFKNRDDVTKQESTSNDGGDDSAPSSTSLPYINFSQIRRDGDAQVPCFSILPPNSPTVFPYLNHTPINNFPTNNFLPTSFGDCYLNSSDNNPTETNLRDVKAGCSTFELPPTTYDRLSSEPGLPNIWNHYS